MRILFLAVSSRIFFYDQVVKPFGLLSIAAAVQDQGHEMLGIEMSGGFEASKRRYLQVDEDLLSQILAFSPDLVAMSSYSTNMHNALFWAGVIKERLPSVRTVVGGNHASYIAREIIEDCAMVDFVVRFEGEAGFRALCAALSEGRDDFSDVPNLTWRRDGQVVENELAPPIMDLDTLNPMPYGLFTDSQAPEEIEHADMITARGCPFRCTFCNCNHFWQKRYRAMSIDRVVRDIRWFKEKYPNLKSIRFRDEAISIRKNHCLELCDALVAENFGLEYHGHSRLDGLDEEVIAALARAGFKQLFIGLESGSKPILQRIRKDIDIDRAPEMARLCWKHGIQTRFSLIGQIPGESLGDIEKSLQLVKNMQLDFDQFYFNKGLQIYPGTHEGDLFAERYPGYKWLRPQELGDGYIQRRDDRGNPLVIMQYAAKYSEEEYQKAFDKAFASRIGPYGFPTYASFLQDRSRLRRVGKQLEESGSLLFSLLDEIDATGQPWALCSVGAYQCFWEKKGKAYGTLKAELTAEDIFSASRLDQTAKALDGIETLVLLASEGLLRTTFLYHQLRYALGFQGACLHMDAWISDACGRKQETGAHLSLAEIPAECWLPKRDGREHRAYLSRYLSRNAWAGVRIPAGKTLRNRFLLYGGSLALRLTKHPLCQDFFAARHGRDI